MSDLTEIHADHPLFRELRNGLLWHCTSAKDYRQIRADGSIKPNDGRVNRWGGQYACQQHGAVSLFDFTTQPEDIVLAEATKWRQFLGDSEPVTVILGLEKNRLQGCRLIPYPTNKEGTTGNVIPWVEVCHCGSIPLSAVVSHLLVCSVDYKLFSPHRELDEQTLSKIENEFGSIVRLKNEEQAERIRAINESPEFKAQIKQAQRREEELYSQYSLGGSIPPE